MRNVERLLTTACFGGSLLAGAEHLTQWLLLPPLCFTALLLVEDRAVHRRIGARTWPSVGYARFLFGTNLYLTVRNTLFSGALFAGAWTVGTLLRS